MDYSIYGVALLPVVIGLLEIVKMFKVPTKYIPLISLAIGILMGIFFIAPGEYPKAILLGVQLGLAAVGLHSGVKHTIEKNGNGK
jgi:hypothetical protein